MPRASRLGIGRRMLICVLLSALGGPLPALGASGENPIIAGMRAMMDSMGLLEKHSPFPDHDPFDGMSWMPGSGMTPWSGMGMTPWSGMGMTPWSGMGMTPWSGMDMMPGLGTLSAFDEMPGFGAMPGMSSFSPWSWAMPGGGAMEYANPERWSREMSRFTDPATRRLLRSDADSPTRELDGLWMNQNGDRLWFRNGWVRITRGQHQDARALLRSGYLYIGIPETKEVMQYEYGLRDDYLGLRDDLGNVQIFRRAR